MEARVIKTAVYLLTTLLLASCKSYYIPVASFNEQMRDIDSVELRTVNTRGPMGDIVSYKTYPIDFIKCVDKNDNPTELKNSPSIEIRFTEKNNMRTVFYFDQIYIKDSTVIGDGSRFIYYRKAIPINNIKLIEVQDGHKNFKYVNEKQ
ncbi:MAG: hypothetical protein EOM83_12315 [Clostridia bacterium]|nr:hypothetical protein [Clostridia bacterium]